MVPGRQFRAMDVPLLGGLAVGVRSEVLRKNGFTLSIFFVFKASSLWVTRPNHKTLVQSTSRSNSVEGPGTVGEQRSHSRELLGLHPQQHHYSSSWNWRGIKTWGASLEPNGTYEMCESFKCGIQFSVPIWEQFQEQAQKFCCLAIPEHVFSRWNPLPLLQVSTALGQGKVSLF